jgi:hypothetical protein
MDNAKIARYQLRHSPLMTERTDCWHMYGVVNATKSDICWNPPVPKYIDPLASPICILVRSALPSSSYRVPQASQTQSPSFYVLKYQK